MVLAGTQKLAGSALRMNRAIANVVRSGDLSLAGALQAATTNPARLIHLEGRTKGLEIGERGDIVVFRKTPEIVVEAVYLDGTRVA